MTMTKEDLKVGNEYISRFRVIRKIIAIGDKRVFYKYRDEHCEQYIDEGWMAISQFLPLLPYVAPKKTKLVTVEVADYLHASTDGSIFSGELKTFRTGISLALTDRWKLVIGSEREIEIEE